MADKKSDRYTYTSEQWSREIGYGPVPKQYLRDEAPKSGTSTDKRRK